MTKIAHIFMQNAFNPSFLVLIHGNTGTIQYETLKFEIFPAIQKILGQNELFLHKKWILNFKTQKLPFHVFAIYFFPESAINLKFKPYEALQGANKSVGHFFEIFIFFKILVIFGPFFIQGRYYEKYGFRHTRTCLNNFYLELGERY